MAAPCQLIRLPVEFPAKNRGISQLHYFAYGSNMNWEQMKRRCPSTQFVCVASLKDYRFAIARHSRLRNCGTANIFADSGSEVWGIVYDVSEPDLIILDSFEDGYRRAMAISYAPATIANARWKSWCTSPRKKTPSPCPTRNTNGSFSMGQGTGRSLNLTARCSNKSKP